MQRKLDELRETLSGFVAQRESLLLVVSAADPEMAYVLKTLEGVDDTSPADLFLIFAEPFTAAPAYASAIMKSLHAQMEAAQASGEDPLPPLPALCDDEGAPPLTRLRAAIDHVSSIVPMEGEHRVVWGFLPLQIDDREGYARLAGDLVPWRGPELWMKGLRVIARDDRDSPFLSPGLRKLAAPRVLLYEIDMSPAALNDALVKEAADRSLPVAARMQSLMQLASLDYAYKRYPQAIEKYGVLYNHHAQRDDKAMQAVTLQGAGDSLQRMNDLQGARVKYQQGLLLAMQTQALPVLLNLTMALGDVGAALGDHRDAEKFFGLSEQLAGRLMNPFARADALEKQGIARDRLGDLAHGVLAWRGAETLSKTFAYHERHRSVLERLIAAYRLMQMSDERSACEAELKAALQAIKADARAAHDHPLRRDTP
jgi:tetratricopeptide (TPR) repeat protein